MQSRTAAGTLASAALRVVPSGMLKTIPGLPTVLAAAPGQPHQPSWMYTCGRRKENTRDRVVMVEPTPKDVEPENVRICPGGRVATHSSVLT